MAEGFIQRLVDRFQGEDDAPQDTGVAASRVTGGVASDERPDQASTTSTTPDDTYVGRIAGDDVGYAGQTGAEARAEAETSPDEGE